MYAACPAESQSILSYIAVFWNRMENPHMKNRKQDISEILNQWPFDPQSVNVRMLESSHREVLQMRVDMGMVAHQASERCAIALPIALA